MAWTTNNFVLLFWLFHGVILSIKETKKARCFCWMSIGAMETMEKTMGHLHDIVY